MKYLGVHIDGDLKYDTQVDKILNETTKGLLRKESHQHKSWSSKAGDTRNIRQTLIYQLLHP